MITCPPTLVPSIPQKQPHVLGDMFDLGSACLIWDEGSHPKECKHGREISTYYRPEVSGEKGGMEKKVETT